MSRMARLITEIGSTKPPDLTLAGLSYHIGIDPDLPMCCRAAVVAQQHVFTNTMLTYIAFLPSSDPMFVDTIVAISIHPVSHPTLYHGVRQPATKILLSSCQAASTAENHQLNTVRHRPVG
ncbi:hypothetical protein DERF_009899 [Dermatophagoides farinae]|uniref:Uncharacterized protein n=1 Tax=Dermatophagoides farinae TaxID=6954 RepID=A0A922HYX7_DERFA|nr:hypothetical protein DERF_009899 [Dermatophagoides farinae]